jgi:hypothetical protein
MEKNSDAAFGTIFRIVFKEASRIFIFNFIFKKVA